MSLVAYHTPILGHTDSPVGLLALPGTASLEWVCQEGGLHCNSSAGARMDSLPPSVLLLSSSALICCMSQDSNTSRA